MSNSVDPDEIYEIWIYAVCKSLLLSPVAMKELKEKKIYKLHYSEVREDILRPPYDTNASCIVKTDFIRKSLRAMNALTKLKTVEESIFLGQTRKKTLPDEWKTV